MKWYLFWGLFWVVALEGTAQKCIAEKSSITFFSDALIEDIKATNVKGASMLNVETNDLVFSIPIRDFQFAKKLMQEHFNEKYLESDKYPKATFSGKLLNFNSSQSGKQSVQAKGKLTIHGVTREVEIDGTATKDDKITIASKFILKLADYKVEIPQLMFQNIAEEIEVTLEFTYKPQ